MDENMKGNIMSQGIWIRGIYMLLFALIYSIAEIVFTAVAVFQFLTALVTGRPNELLLNFGQSLSTYIYQTVQFFTFNSDEKPYPFSPWPEGLSSEKTVASAEKKSATVKRKTTTRKATKKAAAKSDESEK
ncbi:MAG: DUF4389 domain-containing protein [bacterium]|nr:DUF4389 domain-containing protein [bacterium]